MNVPVLYALGIIVTDLPWYMVALVPFWGHERFSRKAVVIIIPSVVILRALGAGLICAFVPDWKMWDTYFLLAISCLQLGVYYLCYKTNIFKLLYTLLLLIVLATSVNFAADMIVRPFYSDPDVVISAEPSLIITAAVLIACFFPFVYRTAKGLIRDSFEQLPGKIFRSLCIVPAIFFIISCFYMVTMNPSLISNLITSFTIIFSGLIASYTTLRMVTDTAKYVHIEKELAAENAALDKQNQMKNDLIANLAHEIRTPLTVMSTYAQLAVNKLRSENFDAQVTADLETLDKEAKRLAELASSTLSVLGESAGQEQHRPVTAGEILTQLTRLFTPSLKKKDNRVILDIPDDLPPVMGNADKLTQVIWNLLSNANEHTKSGVISITVQLEKDNGIEQICVTVADTGDGIEPELLPFIFDRHVKGSSGGAGIGLSICKDIIDEHNGTIEVKSEPGKGSKVRFTLPAMKEQPPPPEGGTPF